jgi:glycine cleavage system H protein
MDGFSYSNIFETKGIEYLIIITFLIMIIPFWRILSRQTGITNQIKRTLGSLSAGILKIPQGLFLSSNHTWAHLEKSGTAMVGLDGFLMHITGEVNCSNIKKRGDLINRGDLVAEIDQSGKQLKIYSPLSGEITDINILLNNSSEVLIEDPFGKGWIYKIKPSKWITETSSCYLAEEAVAWSKMELERFRDFLADSQADYSPEPSMIILQDGGELIDQPLAEQPVKVWQNFQESFLSRDPLLIEHFTSDGK